MGLMTWATFHIDAALTEFVANVAVGVFSLYWVMAVNRKSGG